MSEDKPAHSPIGASSMYRWKSCPGSVKLSEGRPNNPSVYAQEGTAAHELVALALERTFNDQKESTEILNDIFKALNVYTTYVEKVARGNKVWIEHSFDMREIHPLAYGTADCVVYQEEKYILEVIDYKHGMGLPVEAENNLQAQYYALGALTTLPDLKVHWVRMTIVQPRCYHPAGLIRSWLVPVTHFFDFKLELIAAAKETEKKRAKLHAGDHCLFCPAKEVCPEYENKNFNEAKKQFGFYNDPKKDFEPIEDNTYQKENNNFDWGF